MPNVTLLCVFPLRSERGRVVFTVVSVCPIREVHEQHPEGHLTRPEDPDCPGASFA